MTASLGSGKAANIHINNFICMHIPRSTRDPKSPRGGSGKNGVGLPGSLYPRAIELSGRRCLTIQGGGGERVAHVDSSVRFAARGRPQEVRDSSRRAAC